MKKTSLLLLFAIVIIQFGCEEYTEPEGKDIYIQIDVESAFQNDLIRVQLDDKILVETKVTTNYTISLAWSSGLQKLKEFKHTLFFSLIDFNIKKIFDIDLTNDTSTVVIRFNRDSKIITIEQFKGLLYRD